jgi:mono/diheme cytochrome c family protein
MADWNPISCFSVTLAIVTLVCLLPGASSAQQAATGKDMFERYCSSCHGTDAKGDGPLANLLTAKPADLTQLAKQNGGTFPGVKVMRAIDGREEVRAHGTSDMPVWGERFKAESAAVHTRETAVRGRAQEIVQYIQSIQEK